MHRFKTILTFIEKDSYSINCHWSNYIVKQLKAQRTLEIILTIMDRSNKVPSEAVFIFIAAIKYLYKDFDALDKLETTDSFQKYISENYEEIIEISINRKVQANIPERAFPISEILSKYVAGPSVAIIELGASYGLLGRCLLHLNSVIENRNYFFKNNQVLPVMPFEIVNYLGIEIEPPDKDWLLASYPDSVYAKRINSFIDFFKSEDCYKLIRASAFNFSELKETIEIIKGNYKIVVLTSYILYQLDDLNQKKLKDEIMKFSITNNGHWINQDVDLKKGIDKLEYYIEWDGNKVIELKDDLCNDWKWLV